MKRHHLTDELNVWALARDFLHAYMPKMRGLSPNTIQAYRISLESFLGYLTQQQHIDRSEIRFEHFDRQQFVGGHEKLPGDGHEAARGR